MIFRQVTHDDLGCASYLIGDHRARVAVVVDPRFEIDVYLEHAHVADGGVGTWSDLGHPMESSEEVAAAPA